MQGLAKECARQGWGLKEKGNCCSKQNVEIIARRIELGIRSSSNWKTSRSRIGIGMGIHALHTWYSRVLVHYSVCRSVPPGTSYLQPGEGPLGCDTCPNWAEHPCCTVVGPPLAHHDAGWTDSE